MSNFIPEILLFGPKVILLPDFDKQFLIWPKVFFATTIFVNWAYHQYTRGCHFRLGFNPEKLCVSEVLVVFWCSPRILAIFWRVARQKGYNPWFWSEDNETRTRLTFPRKINDEWRFLGSTKNWRRNDNMFLFTSYGHLSVSDLFFLKSLYLGCWKGRKKA